MVNYRQLSDQQLIGLLIGESSESFVAEGLMKAFHDLPSLLLHAAEEELLQVKGIGDVRATKLMACSELFRRLHGAPKSIKQIKGPDDCFQLLKDMRFLQKEHFRIILLNTKNHVLSIEDVSVGNLNSSIVHPREVFASAIKRSAAHIVVAHNHPSGDPKPSSEDIAVTKRLVEAGEILGITVLDHIVIGAGCYVSFKEEDLF